MSSYVTALQHFNESRTTLKMTTGSANLDSLIDSIQEGQYYLFYGSNKGILDGLVLGLLVNCILPRTKHGFESMALYINNVDYYQQDKSKVLSPEKIAVVAKCAGIEPKIVFKNLFVQIAYNQKHQLSVARQVCTFLETNGDITLVVVNNITKFFREAKAKDKNYAAGILKETSGILCKALICTGDANVTKSVINRRIMFKTLQKSFLIDTCEWLWCEQRIGTLKNILVSLYGTTGSFWNRFANVDTFEAINVV